VSSLKQQQTRKQGSGSLPAGYELSSELSLQHILASVSMTATEKPGFTTFALGWRKPLP